MKLKNKLCVLIALGLLYPQPVLAFADSNGTFERGRDDWVISNISSCFKDQLYTDTLLDEHLSAIRQNLNHVEYRLIEDMLTWEEFPGVCYGFASTSMLACYDILNPDEHYEEIGVSKEFVTGDLYSLIMSNYSPPYGTGWDRSLLYYYMATQCTDAIRQAGAQKGDWSIQQKLQFLEESGKQSTPVLLNYYWSDENGERYAHSVLAYGMESGAWEWNSISYDSRILIYDCTMPTETSSLPEAQQRLAQARDEACLYYNSGQDIWAIPWQNATNENGDLITLVDDVGVVNAKGLLPGTTYTPEKWIDVVTTNLLHTDYTVTTADESNAVPEYPFFYMDGEEGGWQNFMNKGDESPYILKVEQPQELISAAYYENSMLKGVSASGSQVNFDPSGMVAVSGNTANYRLEMVFNENYITDWYDIVAEGTSQSAELRMTDQGYLLTGDDLHNVVLTAKNLQSQKQLAVSTDETSILFYQKSNGSLAAATDPDGDGVYDASLEVKYQIGDVDGSGTVDASDAAEILIAAANIGAGNDSGLTNVQELFADVDGNGTCDASDASQILLYAAEVGAGSFSGTLDGYRRKNS